MKIAIFGQQFHHNTKESLVVLFECLQKHSAVMYLEFEFANFIQQKFNELSNTYDYKIFKEIDNSFNLLVSIGGDGTILRAITHVKDSGVPIVGINTGRLGFLATIQINEIESAFNDFFNRNYTISERSLVAVYTDPPNKSLKTINFALNEVAVSRRNTTSMISVDTHLDGEYLTSYWADGLIVATPTGSTGYSLSCGGPVITPKASNFVITPIAPHNLNARPLIIPDATEIKLKVNGREDNFLLSLDSRLLTLSNDTTISIKRANFKIKMIEFQNESFINTLRKKMLWGEDRRN